MISDGLTIIACASGAEVHAAIAIIRLSGFSHLSELQPFFSLDLSDLKPRSMAQSKLLAGERAMDDICLCFFAAPKSYTGENVLELYVHGNTLNVERILKLFTQTPTIRLARPGEFTLRALQNKKLTLAQVEGLDLFLNASTPLALEQGLALMHGELYHQYMGLLASFTRHKAALELLLDFSEDVGDAEARAQLMSSWAELFGQLASLKARLDPHSSRLLRPEIVIAGEPNAGKSTLFNQLLREERAIVSPVAGTTRDYLAEDISIEGVTYRLVDTAGLRATSDQIEARGIELARERLARAFFKILLVNPLAAPLRLVPDDFDVVLYTHADQPGFAAATTGVVLSGQQQICLLKDNDFRWLLDRINKKYLDLSGRSPLLLERHKSIISNAYALAQGYNKDLPKQSDLAILSHELNALGHCLQELLGLVSPDEVLDHIFANFCIGK